MIAFHLTFIKHFYSTLFSETVVLKSCKIEEAHYRNRALQWSLPSILAQLSSSADPNHLRKTLSALSDSHIRKNQGFIQEITSFSPEQAILAVYSQLYFKQVANNTRNGLIFNFFFSRRVS